MTVSTGTRVPVEETRIALGRPLRVALVHGRDEASRRAVAHLALASGAEIVARIRATDPRSFVEAAQALRDAKPDVVVIQGGPKEQTALAELLEALRLGCGVQRPMPRVFGLVDTRVAHDLRTRASPFEFERFGTASEMVASLRALRARNGDAVLRDALIENGARSLATTTATLALAVDVTERSTSLVLARPDGRIEAAHFVPLGLGMGADHAVVRASLDNVRRWLPWPIDAPALLERMFNRRRLLISGPATTEAAVLLEMALAREAISHALRDAADAGLDVPAMRSAPSILITGQPASFPNAGQSLLVLVDGLEPNAVSTVFREPDEGRAERIGMVVSVATRKSAKIRIVRASGRSVARVVPGSFGLVHIGTDVEIAVTGAGVRGHGRSGELGMLIDARGRPLSLPERDAERIPAVTRWHAALQAIADDGNAG